MACRANTPAQIIRCTMTVVSSGLPMTFCR